MNVPDLTASQGTFDLILRKVNGKLDGADNAFQYTLDLEFPITGRGVAEQLEEQIPGLADSFDRAIEEGDKWRASNVVKSDVDVKAVLYAKAAGGGIVQGPVEPGGVVIQGSARVMYVKSDLSKRQQRVMVRLCMGGQPASVAHPLTASLERLVTFSFERAQMELGFTRSNARPALRVGMVVTLSGDAGERGKVVEIDDDAITIREEGVERVVHQSEIMSSISFSDDPSTEDALQEYQRWCGRQGRSMSWGALVDVLTHADVDAQSGVYRVTLEHVEQVVGALEEAHKQAVAAMEAEAEVKQKAASAAEPATDGPDSDNVVQLNAPKSQRRTKGRVIAS